MERLREAAGEGRLTFDELDERLDIAFHARTLGELVPLTADLPVDLAKPVAAVSPSGPTIGGTPRVRRSLAILGGAERRGAWTLPEHYKATAILGGVELDLTEATFETREVTIHCMALLGGVEIFVPDGVNVIIEGSGLLGGFEGRTGSDPLPPDAPTLHVTGMSVLGGVDVRRKSRRRWGRRRDLDAQRRGQLGDTGSAGPGTGPSTEGSR